MKLILKRTLLAFGALLLLLCIGGLVIVIQARSSTPETIAKALAAARITASQLSPEFKEIVLRVEDPKFYEHHGIDFSTPGAGKTTITQGLVKIFYFEDFTPGLVNKAIQSIVARFSYDPQIAKDDQLTLFLNYAYLGTVDGKDVIGFPAAASVYYGKDFFDLHRDEFIGLVGMLVAPNQLDPLKHPQQHRERIMRIENVLSGRYSPKDNDDVYYDRDDQY